MRQILGVGRGFFFLSFTGYPNTRNIHLLFPVLRCLTCGRKCRLYIREKRKHNRRSVGKAGKRCRKASGSRSGPIRASSPLKGRRTRGADCRVEPRQAHKANRRSWAPDAVMATVMQVARRDLNLDRKKESRGMDYYYRVPHEKYET